MAQTAGLRVAIGGGPNGPQGWSDAASIERVLDALCSEVGPIDVACGTKSNVEKIFGSWMRRTEYSVQHRPFEIYWEPPQGNHGAYDRRAAMMNQPGKRNQKIIDEFAPQMALTFALTGVGSGWRDLHTRAGRNGIHSFYFSSAGKMAVLNGPETSLFESA